MQLTEILNNISRVTRIQESIKSELLSLWENTHAVWRQAYKHCRQQSKWERNNVQIFISGGGAKLPFVKEIFRKSWMNKPGQNWGPYLIDRLPTPDDYNSIDNTVPFERLSVAYGLTQPLPTLGKFILPIEAPDHTPPRPVPLGNICNSCRIHRVVPGSDKCYICGP